MKNGVRIVLASSGLTAKNIPPMVHQIVLFKLKPELPPSTVEDMMRTTRMTLLKIPEVLSVKCGKRIEPECNWPFFTAVDYESMDKMEAAYQDARYIKYVQEVLKPNVSERLVLDYEMDPGKDVRYS